jgi:hypothetical protein
MGLRGKGMLVVFSDADAADESDLNEWYNREHIDERVAMPGFRRARRYVAVTGDPKYLATYECRSVADLADPNYLKALANPTPWSRRVTGRFTKFHRLTLRIRVDAAHGIGGAVTCVRLVPDPRHTRRFIDWLKRSALPAAIAEPGMVGAIAGANDLAVANAPARAQGVGFPEVAAVEWVVLVEGAEPRATSAAATTHLSPHALSEFGVTSPPIVGTYRFLFGNAR